MGESRITPSGIINDAVSMIGKMNDSSFPIDIFPNKIRNIILNMYEYLAFPIDYTACSMMTAISTCIGNTHILHFKTGWDIKCIIYMALVGRPGANKSHPLKTAFEPLFRFDKEQKEIYNEEYRKYESIMSLSKKERLEQGFDMFPKEPVRTRFLVSDITQEAMAKSISENPRGICLYMDELQGWINNFTHYNKGSEEQFYISLFNGYMYISDRKMNTNNIMIDSPFSNVIGTIQPEILIDTFKGSKSNNGFLDRILFAIPEIQDKNINRVFNAFFSTSTPASFDAPNEEQLIGTGLGLKIVKDIIVSYKGSICIIPSYKEYSTCFQIKIPKN